MSDKPAEVSTQPKASTALLEENPQITPEFLQELDAIPPGGYADALANLPQSKKGSVVGAEKKPAPEKKAPEAEAEPGKETDKPEVETQTETETKPGDEAAPEATEEEPVTTEEEPAAEAETEADPDKQPEAKKLETEEEEAEEPEEDPKKVRVRLDKMTSLDKKVVLFMRAGLTAEDAMNAAKKALGITDKTTEGKPAPAAVPEELTAAQADLETAENEVAEAIGNFDKDATKAAMKKVNLARDKVQETKEKLRAADSHEKIVALSVAKAKAEYPDAGSFDTPLGELVHSRLIRIEDDPSHPLHGDPDAPYKVTMKAAQDLKVPSKTAKPAAPTTLPAKTAAPAATRVKPAPPVSGAARTTTVKPDPIAAARLQAKKDLGEDGDLLDAAVPQLATK